MNLSTWHSAPITRGCGRELSSAVPIHRLQGRASNSGCHSHYPSATWRILLSIDLDAFPASIPVRTCILTKEHQNKANVASILETHRGLTAHEEPAPAGEVFGNDE